MKAEISFLTILLFSFLFIKCGGYDVKVQKENYSPDYRVYHNVSRIMTELVKLENLYKDYVTLNQDFKSRKGIPQILVKLSAPSSDKLKVGSKVKILMVFGEHAREFFPIESMFYFLHNVTAGLSGADVDSSSRKYSDWVFDNFDIDMISLANPDGRMFIEHSKNYCWRGTSSGVDINRNFDWNFGGKGSSADPNDGEYRGLYAFSEPETKIFRNITKETSYDAFISFHSGIRHIYIPFADSKSRLSHHSLANRQDHLRLAARFSQASKSRPFRYGFAYDLNKYSADGTSFDYMAGVRKIPFSFAIEMWEHKHHVGKSCFDEFNPRSEDLQKELELFHPLYVELLLFLHSWKKSYHHKKDHIRQHLPAKKIKDRVDRHIPRKYNTLFTAHSRHKTRSKSSTPSSFMYYVIFFGTVLCIGLGLKRVLFTGKKKRIVSIKSLSSSFSMLKML